MKILFSTAPLSLLVAIILLINTVQGVLTLSCSPSTIKYQSCTDANCGSGSCSSQNLPAGECLKIEGSTSSSVKLSCSNASNIFCSRAGFYKDSKCTERVANADSVCNSCQNSFSISCGALFGATFITNNCSLPSGLPDPTCNSCAGPTIVSYRLCHSLPQSTDFVMIMAPGPCDGVVNWELYQNSTSCQGTPIQAQYWDGHCNSGMQLSCSSSSSQQKESLHLMKKEEQKTIKVDMSKLRFLH